MIKEYRRSVQGHVLTVVRPLCRDFLHVSCAYSDIGELIETEFLFWICVAKNSLLAV